MELETQKEAAPMVDGVDYARDYPATMALALLVESKLNPRKIFNEITLAELAVNVAAVGVIQPLIVRPELKKAKETGRYEIVAGSRRYRAAIRAKLEKVPIKVVLLNDAQALDVMISENGHRDDVHPLEEAAAFDARLSGGGTVEDIASKSGHSAGHVYKRLQLLKLIPELSQEFMNGRLNLASAQVIARIAGEHQKTLSKWITFKNWNNPEPQIRSLHEINDWISANVMLSLSAASWKKDDPLLLPKAGSCLACTKRTGANLELFDDVKPGDDRCLDVVCYKQKAAAVVLDIRSTIEKSGEEMVRVYDGYQVDKKFKGALGNSDYKKADAQACVHLVTAEVVGGELARTIKVCLNRKCKIHWSGSYSSIRRAVQTPAQIWKDKEASLKHKISTEARSVAIMTAAGKVSKIGRKELELIAYALLETDLAELPLEVMFEGRDVAASKATDSFAVRRKEQEELVAAADEPQLMRLIMASCLDASWQSGTFGKPGRGAIALKTYRVDLKAIEKKVGDRMRAEFRKEKAAALAKLKTKGRSKKAN